MAMKRQSFMNNGRSINGADLLSGYHHIQPFANHTFTYGSSYARGHDAAVLATSLHWNRDIKSTATINRSPSSSNNLVGSANGINKTFSPDNPMIRTIGQHYYPEGGWGWIISVCSSLCYFITSALFPSHSFLILDIMRTFKPDEGILAAVLIGAFSTMVTLIFSPIIIALCRRKSIRLTAVVGGLVTALGCLFTSFATQFHQLLISYGLFIGIGVSMLRDTSVIMIGQYFKKRREFVEIFVNTGNGLGIALMPIFLSFCIKSQSWRTGFQSLALVAFINFFIGVLYRPASLYHPQRRAILHLKSLQKKSRHREAAQGLYNGNLNANINATNGLGPSAGSVSGHHKPAYFDFSILKSKTIRILLSGTCISAFGLWTPIFLLAYHGEKAGMAYSALLGLQTFLGLGIVLGTVAFGLIVVKNSVDCMIARQYLCQASSLMISASLLAFSALDDYSGYLLFVWIYGFFLGGYTYSLKMYVYEKVKARNFNRAWSFVQCIQSVPIMVGVPITGFISEYYGNKSGFFLSSFCTAFGALTLFLIDGTKRPYDDKHKISGMSPERTYGFTAPGVALDQYESSPIPYGGPDTRIYIDPLVFTGRPLIPGPNGTENLAQVNFTALKALSAATAMSNQHPHMTHSSLLSPIGSGRTAVGPCGELYSTINQRPCGPTVFNAAASLTSNGQTTSTSVSGTTTAAAAAAAAAAAVAAASAELTCISEEVFMENLLDEYCPPECINPCSRHEDKYLILSDINKAHQQDKCRLNDATHNNVSSFGKHAVRSSDLTGNFHHDVPHNGRFTFASCLNSELNEFNSNYQCRENSNTKLQQVQRRASLPIINNTNTGYLGELGIGQNGEDSSTNDEGLTNKLATMKDNIDGFIGDLLNSKMSSAAKMHSENQVQDCCDVTNLNDGVPRWRSASESTGYVADEGGSDDSDSNHDRLINRCSGCLRFVHEQSIGRTEKVDSPETPLINNQQFQQHHYQQHSNHSQHQNQVQSFNQTFEPPTAPMVLNSTANLTPTTATVSPSAAPSATETKVNSFIAQELTNETTAHLTTKEHKINEYDVNGTSGFNDDLAKE
uniref:Major facilitator superfamily (MFS) profile domain-containing protein n=1 Tax=Tetranychus urticae TaxID=32264 RepID=T1K3E6_TETUR